MNTERIKIWKLSPGEKGRGWNDCLNNGTIGIGWAHEEDLHGLIRDEINEYTREKYYPEDKPGYIANQLIDFIFHIKKDHVIIAYSSPSTIYGVGIVEENDWKYNENVNGELYWLRNTRKVKWVKPFSKIIINDNEIKSILGQRQTIVGIKNELFINKLIPLFSKKTIFNLYEIETKNLLNHFSIEEDEQWIPDESFEEKKKLRYHKYVERNSNLSKKAKEIHGYTCMACGFNFEEKYGEIGKNYIEAHHTIPFFKLEENAKVSPKSDMAVLCANCHRMIHKLKDIPSIKEFKKTCF